jgi:integrase
MVRTTATVGDLLTEWIEFAAPDFSPKTEKETRGYIERNLDRHSARCRSGG